MHGTAASTDIGIHQCFINVYLHDVFHLPTRMRNPGSFSTTPLQLLMYRTCILYIYTVFSTPFYSWWHAVIIYILNL